MNSAGHYRKPRVLAAIPPGRHAVLEASAGTGKTYALEHLVASLLLQGLATVEQLLVVTFTEKAAAELRGRVRRLLEKLLATQGPPPPGVHPDECWVIDEMARRRLADALRCFDSAAICTIHAFCRQALSEHAFANRRLFDERLADTSEQFGKAFRDVLRTRGSLEPELKGWLKAWKEEGLGLSELEKVLGLCSSLGGPIVPSWDPERIDQAFAALPPLEEALALAGEVSSRCVEKTQNALHFVYGCREAWAGSKGQNRLTRHRAAGALHGLNPELTTKTCPVALRYAQEKLAELGEKVPASQSAHPAAALAELLAELAGSVPGVVPMVAATFLPWVEEQLAQRKRQAGLFDFDDMLALVDQSLAAEGSPLLKALRRRFRYALIDEFQDTDEVQWSIFRRLFFESEEGHVLYLIGDPKQAIYRFRGADVGAYLLAKREVLGEGEPVYLEENFRSTPELIAAYNAILDQRAAPPFFKGQGIRYDRPVRCGKPELKLVDPVSPAPVQVLITDQERTAGGIVLPILGRAIAAEIRRLVAPGSPTVFLEEGGGKRRALEHRDIYVLAATRPELGRVAEQLREAGLPFAFYKQRGLFQCVEARHLEAVLEAIANPNDRSRCFRAWLTPFFGLELSQLSRAADIPESHELVARLRDWNRLAEGRNHERLFRLLLDESGLTRRLILFGQGERALTNYLHLIDFLRQQLASRGASVTDMARQLRTLRQEADRPQGEDADLQRLETERDAVQLLTMHMAKGLEAPVVFLAGGFSRLGDQGGVAVRPLHLPSGVSDRGLGPRALLVGRQPKRLLERAEDETQREQERLMYVALTRAAARLYLPFVGLAEGFVPAKRVDGGYRHLNDRLQRLLSERQSGARPELSGLFCVRRLEASPAAPPPEIAAGCARVDEALLSGADETLWPQVSERHAGFITTSFSGMQRLGHPVEEDAEETRSETLDRAQPPPDELPGGAHTGSFLHEVLAAVPPRVARAAKSAEALGRHPEFSELFAAWASRFGIEQRHRAHALRLVHTALCAPLSLGGVPLEGIAFAGRLLPEVEFLYPIPEEGHPRLGQVEEGRPFEIRRGFVVGFLDLVFEHRGRVYFADWKSNCLPDFERPTLEAAFKPYELQARLYTLALVKMLSLGSAAAFEERFGGLLFLFLRGMQPGGKGEEGVVFRKPGWDEVCGWEQELLLRKDLGPRGVA